MRCFPGNNFPSPIVYICMGMPNEEVDAGMRRTEHVRIWIVIMLVFSLALGFVSLPSSLAEAAADEVTADDDAPDEEPEPATAPRPGKEPQPEDLLYPGLTLKAVLGYDGRIT